MTSEKKMNQYLVTFLLLATFNSMSQAQVLPSTTKSFALRLAPHQDAKKVIVAFAMEHHIQAGCILSAVGSMEQINLRYANQERGTLRKGHFEVVSLTGTFSDSSSHLHIAVSDSTGATIGGHLLEGNLVYTTLELVLADLTDVTFEREKDSTYGYLELIIKPRKKPKK